MEAFDNPEERAFRFEVRKFYADNLPDRLRHMVQDRINSIDRATLMEWHQVLMRQGWAAPSWSVEHGGTGWTLKQQYIYEQEIAAAWAPWALPFAFDMIGPFLIAKGSAYQKQRFLPKMRSGEEWWCQGFSEPGAGSDLAALNCRAERKGDRFVINGSKIWQTAALDADMMFGLFRTSSEGKKQHGISLLLVDMRAKGLTIQPIRLFDGIETVAQCFFDDVEVPVENLVGEENQGWPLAKYLLTLERLGIAEVARSKASLNRLKDILVQNPGIGMAHVLQPMIMQIEAELLALEATEYRMLFDPGANGELGAESSILKLCGSSLRQRIAELTAEVFGAVAPFSDSDAAGNSSGQREQGIAAARAYANLMKVTIYGGSNEIQRGIVAKAVLGV
jgi:alkylation response protein AidB-like acyl-CoA dehydrogenase